MAQSLGLRTTTQAVDATSTTQIVRQVDDQLVLLEPNETPLVTLLMRLKKRFPVYTTQFEWLEDDFVARWAYINDATINGTAGHGGTADTSTTAVVDDVTKFVVGDTFAVPSAASSGAVPEVCLVTSTPSTGAPANSIVFTRGVGGSPKVAISNLAALRILGPAYGEGAAPPQAKSTVMNRKVSYTQIFRTAINLSKTQAAVKQYGKAGGERKFEQKKKLIEHKIKLNSAALFGAAQNTLTDANGNPLRTTMGVVGQISTNAVNVTSGVLDKKTFEAFARKAFRYGKSQKLLVAAPTIISAIHDWGNSFLLVKPGEKLLGVDIERVETGHGTFMLCRDWMLENSTQSASNGNGFGGMALSLDLDECSYFYLNNNGENRDTRILEDVVKTGQDAYTDEILTEGGFAFKFEPKHAKLTGVTDYVA
jgi:Family of unknown function (DUF5309)